MSKQDNLPKDVAPQESPPWVTYYEELRHSLGASPNVVVGPLIPVGDNYLIIVTADTAIRAQAVANIINLEKDFGGVLVQVSVRDAAGNAFFPICRPEADPFLVAHDFLVALAANPYLSSIKVEEFTLDPNVLVVYPIFTSSVIQFWNDDLSNYYRLFTEVASKVFADVLKLEVCDVPVLYSTLADVQFIPPAPGV